jgi:lysozyme
MSPSSKAFSFIEHEEGCILHPYHDQAGIPTIGWGSTMYKNGKKVTMNDAPITQLEADSLLQWEVDNKTGAIVGYLKNVVLNQNQYDSLVSFVYNVGVGAFAKSTLLKRIRANPQDSSIREAFMMWVYVTEDGKKRIEPVLQARRKREADLYFS